VLFLFLASCAVKPTQELLEAQSLTSDYRDIAFEVFKKLRGTDIFLQSSSKVFISVFGQDPDKVLFQKFASAGYLVKPASVLHRARQRARSKGDRSLEGCCEELHVSRIEQISSNRFKVFAGYYCGTLCEESLEYIIYFNGAEYIFESQKTTFISMRSVNNNAQHAIAFGNGWTAKAALCLPLA